MPQASIKVNGVVGSNTDLPINTLVQLDNQNSGGETTFAWTLLDQPLGTTDVLSSAAVQNPTFTPKKEGTYLVRLVVNAGTGTEQTQTVVCAVRQLKTRTRVPAAGETTEPSASRGWATDVGALLQLVDAVRADPALAVGVAGDPLARGNVVVATDAPTIKTGLPGEERVPTFTLTSATDAEAMSQPLCVFEGKVAGGTSANIGDLILVRRAGLFKDFAMTPGNPLDPVFVTDTGTLANSPGTYRRRLGVIAAAAAGTTQLWLDGAPQDLLAEFLKLTGGLSLTRHGGLITGTYAPTAHEVILPVNSAASVFITPANATRNNGRLYLIHDATGGAAAKPITIDPEGGTLIDGAASVQITQNRGARLIYDDGTNWFTALAWNA